MAMSLKDRLDAIALDLQNTKHRFSSIDANALAQALGIEDCDSPGGDWSRIYYAQIVPVEEYAKNFSPASELVYLLEGEISPERLDELVAMSRPLDDTDEPRFDFLTEGERKKLELAIAKKELELLSSSGMNCLAHTSVKTDDLIELEFEAVIEDDGTSFILLTPYDKKAKKFQDLSNCVTDR